MEHLKKDLGHLERGATVVVTLRNRANVRLMSVTDYQNYVRGQRYQYIGGQAVKSPVMLDVPSGGTWLLAIDLGGLSGRVEATVTVRRPTSV